MLVLLGDCWLMFADDLCYLQVTIPVDGGFLAGKM
jgi:hypothetical protein